MSERKKVITLTGIQWLQVFSACQALTLPSGAYGVTHKRCKQAILKLLGYCPPGKPGVKHETGPKGFREIKNEHDYFRWLGIQAYTDQRNTPGAVTNKDRVKLMVNVPKRSKIEEAA